MRLEIEKHEPFGKERFPTWTIFLSNDDGRETIYKCGLPYDQAMKMVAEILMKEGET